jgi:hypothetical protein
MTDRPVEWLEAWMGDRRVKAKMEDDGETITISIPGDWAVTGVSAEFSREWPLSREAASTSPLPDGVDRTIIQLQPRRGGL